MSIIGLDIGGANLKAAHVDGRCVSQAFPLWKSPELLTPTLRELIGALPPGDKLAVTMTGELADCFATKQEGVASILDAVEEISDGRESAVWSTSGEFVPAEFAREFPLLVAAANWHALATWLGRMCPTGNALLVDIGTTTTDIIPLENGIPVPVGLTDLDRLQSGELEYSGVARTPLAAIAHSVPFREGRCAVSAETFATTLDLYLWLRDIPEQTELLETANGKPATRDYTRDRLCRMLCADRTEVADEELDALCLFLKDVQSSRIRGAVDRVLAHQSAPCEHVLLSGRGEFLAAEIIGQHARLRTARVQKLSSVFTPEIAESACAFALTRLAEELL